jgi:hypothetical protein
MRCLFKETQRFTQWWVWLILFFSLAPLFYVETNSLYIKLIGVSLLVFIYIIKLNVKVDNNGLHYQFFPIHMKHRTIKFEEVIKFEAITYSPIMDYGGWGIRYRFKGKAYNIKGNKGVQIYLKNGKKILFGSQNYKEFEFCLNKYIQSSDEFCN